MIACAPRNERGRHHHAGVPQGRDLAVNPEPARPGLVDEDQLAPLRLLSPYHFQQRTPIPANLPEATHLTAWLGDSDVDRFLVHIHAHEHSARLFHGLPPFSVFAPPCQTCGSARSSRNPRYRGGGPPALERKPFCLEGFMIDRNARNRLAEGIRHLAAGTITNDGFEERALSSSTDPAVHAVFFGGPWFLYHDLMRYRLICL